MPKRIPVEQKIKVSDEDNIPAEDEGRGVKKESPKHAVCIEENVKSSVEQKQSHYRLIVLMIYSRKGLSA